jgi:hypothetical protein
MTQGILTLLVNSRRSISNARGVSVTRGMYALALAFNPRLQDRFSVRLLINQQSHSDPEHGRVDTAGVRRRRPPRSDGVHRVRSRLLPLNEGGPAYHGL